MHKRPHDNLEYWVYIDNKEVIRSINNTTTLRLTEYYAPEYELSEEITTQIRNTCAKGHWLWIASHTEAQDQASNINRYVDKLAEHFRVQNIHKLRELSFPSNKATILYDNSIINTKVFDHLLNNTSNTTLRKYLQEKYDWSDNTFQDINWNAHRGALLSMPTPLRITTIKIIHNWGASGIRNKLIEKKTDKCPFCNEEKETFEHVFECPKHDITTIWSSLQRHLLRINTMPAIQGCFKKYFSGIKPTEVKEHTSTDELLNRAIRAQERIGIRRARVGHLSLLWTRVQEDYIHQSSPTGPEDGLQWSTQATTYILRATKEAWSSRNTALHSNANILLANNAAIIEEISELQQTLRNNPYCPDTTLLNSTSNLDHHQKTSELILWKKTYDTAIQVSLKTRNTQNTI